MKILEVKDAICCSQVRDSHLKIILRSKAKISIFVFLFSNCSFLGKWFANSEHATGGQSVSLEARTRSLGTSIR